MCNSAWQNLNQKAIQTWKEGEYQKYKLLFEYVSETPLTIGKGIGRIYDVNCCNFESRQAVRYVQKVEPGKITKASRYYGSGGSKTLIPICFNFSFSTVWRRIYSKFLGSGSKALGQGYHPSVSSGALGDRASMCPNVGEGGIWRRG